MKYLTTLLLVVTALAFSACANREHETTAYSNTRSSTTGYSK